MKAGGIGEDEFAAKFDARFPDNRDPEMSKRLFVAAMKPFLGPLCRIRDALDLRPAIRAIVIDPAALDRFGADDAA